MVLKKTSQVKPIEVGSNHGRSSCISSGRLGDDYAQENEASNVQVFPAHWFYSKLYAFLSILMFVMKFLSAISFFHYNPWGEMTDSQASGQRFGYFMVAWSLNLYYLLPYFRDENKTREEKDVKSSVIFVVGSASNIMGTIIFGIYSYEFSASDQLFDSTGLAHCRIVRTIVIASTVLLDLVFGFMFGNCELTSYDPRKDNDRYKLSSCSDHIRDVGGQSRLDIDSSSCFKIVIRNRGKTAVRFGDPECVDPTFHEANSLRFERKVTRITRFFYCIKWKTEQKVDFSVRIMKTVPPGGEIYFVPEFHNLKSAFRIKGLRSFCVDRGDIVETKMFLSTDTIPFLTKVERFNRISSSADKYAPSYAIARAIAF